MTEPLDDAQCKTPMSDHIARFWETLAEEHVRIRIDIRRPHEPDSGVMYHWDSASFPNDVAKGLLASRAAPVPDDARGELLTCKPVSHYESRDCYHIEACPHFVAVIMRAQKAEAELAVLRAAPARCDAENAGLRQALEEIRRAYVEAPGWAAPTPTTELIWKMYSLARAALSPDPGTVAVASAQYRCTCGAEPYCAPNVHAASCPLAVTSTHHRTPEGK